MAVPNLARMHRVLFLVVALGSTTCGSRTSIDSTQGETEPEAGRDATDAAAHGGTDATGAAPPHAADAGADVPGIHSEAGACSSTQDCVPFLAGEPAPFCCIKGVCLFGQTAVDALSCADGDLQRIAASSYDQSCQIDSDCVPVAETNFCGNMAICPNAAINKNALSQYESDIAKTTVGMCFVSSSCPFSAGVGPCCRAGMCRMGLECE